jgi:hypothetical protein
MTDIAAQLNNIQTSLVKASPKNGVGNGVRPQNKNLKPFKKGENGGYHRNKGDLDYKTRRENAMKLLMKEEKKTDTQIDAELTAAAIKEARAGNFAFYKDDTDRLFGQSVSRSEIGGLDGDPIKIDLGIQRILDKEYGDSN